MDKDKYIKKLVEVGLLPREARIYLSLLTKNSFTATEIAKISGIPRQKIYEILDNIIKKGICIEKVGKVKRYKAVKPESVFRGLIEQYKEKEKLALGLSDDLSALYEKNRENTAPLDYIEIIKNPYQIHKRYIQLIGDTREEMLSFTKPPFTGSTEKRKAQDNKVIDILRRGIRIKCIYEILTDEDEKGWQLELIKSAITDGVEAKVLKELPMKMAIFDSRIVMYSLEDPVSGKISLTTQIVQHRALAETLKTVFETYWAKSEDYHVLEDRVGDS